MGQAVPARVAAFGVDLNLNSQVLQDGEILLRLLKRQTFLERHRFTRLNDLFRHRTLQLELLAKAIDHFIQVPVGIDLSGKQDAVALRHQPLLPGIPCMEKTYSTIFSALFLSS